MSRVLIVLGLLVTLSNCSNENSIPEPRLVVKLQNSIVAEYDFQNFNSYLTDNGSSYNGSEFTYSRISFNSEDPNQFLGLSFNLGSVINEKTYNFGSSDSLGNESSLAVPINNEIIIFKSETGIINILDYTNEFLIGDFDIKYKSNEEISDYTIDASGEFVIKF